MAGVDLGKERMMREELVRRMVEEVEEVKEENMKRSWGREGSDRAEVEEKKDEKEEVEENEEGRRRRRLRKMKRGRRRSPVRAVMLKRQTLAGELNGRDRGSVPIHQQADHRCLQLTFVIYLFIIYHVFAIDICYFFVYHLILFSFIIYLLLQFVVLLFSFIICW